MPIPHLFSKPQRDNQTRKNRNYEDYKGRDKNVIMCRYCDSVHRTSKRIISKLLELINKFKKTTG